MTFLDASGKLALEYTQIHAMCSHELTVMVHAVDAGVAYTAVVTTDDQISVKMSCCSYSGITAGLLGSNMFHKNEQP
jgi:hypothetical protein